MTREQMIEMMVEQKVQVALDGSVSEQLAEMFQDGVVGLEDMSDQDLEQEWVDMSGKEVTIAKGDE